MYVCDWPGKIDVFQFDLVKSVGPLNVIVLCYSGDHVVSDIQTNMHA